MIKGNKNRMKMEFSVRLRFLLGFFAVLCSRLLTLTAGKDLPIQFNVGDFVELTCDIEQAAKRASNDHHFWWIKGSGDPTALFKDDAAWEVEDGEDTTRYKVEKTETKYTIVIWGLTAEDDYTKFSCKLWDSELKDRWKTLKSYRLELKPIAKVN